MRPNLNLNWLRSFEAAARLLSFTAAGQETGLTQTAISQHIKALEAQLGSKLFIRRPKSLQLTDIGKAYLLSVREALTSLDMSTSGLFGPQQASTITVRGSMAFNVWLSPRLGGFQASHPDIGVNLVTTLWRSAASQQPVDVDVILAPQNNAPADLEKLADERIVPVCSVDAAQRIRSARDLPGQTPIHVLGYDDHWARYLSAFGLTPDMSAQRLATDTSVAAVEMAAAGLGCAVVIERFAQQAIDTGRAISLGGAPVDLGQAHYLARTEPPADRRPGAGQFKAWLREQF